MDIRRRHFFLGFCSCCGSGRERRGTKRLSVASAKLMLRGTIQRAAAEAYLGQLTVMSAPAFLVWTEPPWWWGGEDRS